MDGTLAVTGSGLVLGLITAVSPCPLATNLAATVWLTRHAASRRRALLGALAYTAGRVAAYGAIAAMLAFGALGAPAVSHALQEWLPPFVGPLLVLTAMVLLELLPLPFGGQGMSQGTAERLARFGVVGEFALGFLFAITFCPASAAGYSWFATELTTWFGLLRRRTPQRSAASHAAKMRSHSATKKTLTISRPRASEGLPSSIPRLARPRASS